MPLRELFLTQSLINEVTDEVEVQRVVVGFASSMRSLTENLYEFEEVIVVRFPLVPLYFPQ